LCNRAKSVFRVHRHPKADEGRVPIPNLQALPRLQEQMIVPLQVNRPRSEFLFHALLKPHGGPRTLRCALSHFRIYKADS
jgi:hypothetical protein